ncbi:MAG: SGNH/GDSL hydrolase family protein [Anaerovibrio sp.]|uniref:SGNH/GDSL hydrolase family protein n=1 Tax=Anaerovibrio sp. TaxID=1872532 RepID=UPI0025E3C65F|nr:GDSL-type esterase/lipase family protein [Anaerovibrio sp.]MCR5176749.1 SGNH/GDSL hydrolase family protein [Anaerovibrio sp.]
MNDGVITINILGAVELKFVKKIFTALLVLTLLICNADISYGMENQGQAVKIVRINWRPMPGAVSYRLEIMKSNFADIGNRVVVKNRIPSNGYELDVSGHPDCMNYYWRVCPVNYDGIPMAGYSELKPLAMEELNPTSPRPTTEFEKMAYAPLYPAYSWIPTAGSGGYEIRVSRVKKGNADNYQVIREFSTKSNIFYEYGGYTWPGKYMWQVRSLDKAGDPATEWSVPCFFTVTPSAKIAAFGDSITHGGGACNTPPGYLMYTWESYAGIPIKNLGCSGDTVEAMVERFNSDVVCFNPKILIIMGGVNDFREGNPAINIINGMEQIRYLCEENGIIPVFATATPINEELMHRIAEIEAPAAGWQEQQALLNQWIMGQPYHVDVTAGLTDEYGQLRADMTTDGLHPDHNGKRIIGEKIGKYILSEFPEYDVSDK